MVGLLAWAGTPRVTHRGAGWHRGGELSPQTLRTVAVLLGVTTPHCRPHPPLHSIARLAVPPRRPCWAASHIGARHIMAMVQRYRYAIVLEYYASRLTNSMEKCYSLDMVHTRFVELLRQKYPLCVVASAHGGVSGSRTKSAVTITFSPDGTGYDYSGSYTAILTQLGIRPEWCVVAGSAVLSRYYTEAEAQAEASKRSESDEDYHTMATERGFWVDPVTREYAVEHKTRG